MKSTDKKQIRRTEVDKKQISSSSSEQLLLKEEIDNILKKEHNEKLTKLKSNLSIGRAKAIIFIYNKLKAKKINEISALNFAKDFNIDKRYANQILEDLDILGLLKKSKINRINVYIIQETELLDELVKKSIEILKK